jgi:hypothetical protein
MSSFEIPLIIILTSVAGLFIGSTLAYYDVSGLPENQTKMPLCTKECPIEAEMPPLQVVFIPVMNSPGYLWSGSTTAIFRT